MLQLLHRVLNKNLALSLPRLLSAHSDNIARIPPIYSHTSKVLPRRLHHNALAPFDPTALLQ